MTPLEALELLAQMSAALAANAETHDARREAVNILHQALTSGDQPEDE